MASLTERLAIVITGEAVSAVNAFKQVETAAAAAGEKATLSQKASSAFGESFGKLGSTALAAGGIAGTALAVDKLVKSFASATGEVRAFQRVSGASASGASQLVAAFNVLGVDSDAAGKALFRLAHNLDGNSAALSKYGVNIATAKNGSVDLTSTLLNVADAVQKVGPGAQADAIAFAAFGRQATALLPVLLRGREGLKGLFDQAGRQGLVFDQSQLDKGKEFSIATKEAEEAVKGLAVQLGEGLAPALTDATKGLASFIETANQATKPIGGIGGAVEGIAKAGQGLLPISAILDAMHGDFGKIAGDLPVLGTGIDLVHGHFRAALGSIIPLLGDHKKSTKDSAASTADLADAAAKAAEETSAEKAAVKAAQKVLDDFNKATDDAVKAQKNLESAQRSSAHAHREEQDAQSALAKLQAAGAVSAEDVARAEKDVASAAKATAAAQKQEASQAQAVAAAQTAVLDAQVALEKVKKGASAEDVAKAQLSANKSQRDLQRAIIGVADATDKSAQSQVLGVRSTSELLANSLDLADAQDALVEAGFAAKDSQDALTKVQQQGKDGSDDLKAAQQELTAKQDELNKAIQDQADAHQNVIDKQAEEVAASAALNKARAGDPDFAEKLREAQQRVADAHQNTVDQIDAETAAVDALNKAEADLSSQRRGRQNTQDAALATYQAQADAINAANLGGRGGINGPGTGQAISGGRGGTSGPGSITTGVVVTGDLHLQVSGSTYATITQSELAAAARRNGLG